MEYIGNTEDLIDWENVIANLNHKNGVLREFETPYENVATLQRLENNEVLEYDYLRDKNNDIEQAFSKTADSIHFYTYLAETAYDIKIDKQFAQWLEVTPVLSWISEMPVGKCVAPHIDDEEIYWSAAQVGKEKLVRYHCHITEHSMGAALMVADDIYYNTSLGSVYKWANPDDIHCGFNASVKPKFVYHFIGCINE